MLFKFQEIILVLVRMKLCQGQGMSHRQEKEAWTRRVATGREDRLQIYSMRRF